MRRIVYAMMKIRQDQLADQKVSDKRIGECGDMFQEWDKSLSGIASSNVFREVMTSADFTYAIEEFVQRKMVPGYTRMQFAFEPLVKPDVVMNFQQVDRYQQRAGMEDLEYVGEKAQARPGSIVDATPRRYSVYRFEKQLDFSYEALVNDDLGYFENTAELMGASARRTLERYVSRMYTNATTIARLVALGALYSTTGRLTTNRISTARMAFGQRVDDRNDPMEVDLKYIVYHRGLQDTVAQIQQSLLVPELATNAANVIRNSFVAIKDPHMAGTAPNLPWYAFTDYNATGVTPFVLARIQGRPAPHLLRKAPDTLSVTSLLGGGGAVDPILGDFATGNIVVKVSDVWGTYIDGTEGNMFDSRGCYYSSGTAP
ncbi:MAG TPA: hypothetical protein VMX97_03515 [Hyphomicrobiaceae bacterium]|nr:hypothetical protein [Hyphomicrobiaceae bacterium]